MSSSELSPFGPVVLANAGTFAMTSSQAHVYDVSIAWPSTPPPPAGFPVLYVLDADAMFATIVESSRRHARRPDATGVVPLVIVGISHSGPETTAAQRTRDYTPPHEADFRGWIEDELKPAIEARVQIDATRQSVLGHSLAGCWVLQAMLSRRTSFGRFVCVSPSIWSAASEIEAMTAQYISSAAESGTQHHLLLTVGEYEEAMAPWHPVSAAEPARARRAERKMVTRALGVSHALSSVATVHFELLPACDHASALTASLPQALRFVSAMHG